MSKTYLIRTLTPLHVGTGTGLGYVDLPIYREAHTDFPSIPASAIKGVLRTYEIRKLARDLKLPAKDAEKRVETCEEKERDESVLRLAKLFGNQNWEGSLVIRDARILFFPVKSLKGVFALITCPYVIKRFKEDTGKELFQGSLEISNAEECTVVKNSRVVMEDKEEKLVVLEEFTLKVIREVDLEVPKLDEERKRRIVLVSDELFTHMVKTYTEIQTHIKVSVETGTVGALWTEEYVPSEAVFYFMIDRDYTISEKTLQIGGNTTSGKGIAEVVKL